MLPFYMHTISPYLKNKTRLFLLHSGQDFGPINGDDMIMSRLDGYVSATLKPEPYIIHERHNDRLFPNMERERVVDDVKSDMLLNDHFRHNRSIEERFRVNQPTYFDLCNTFSGPHRFHRSISRGLERHVVDNITRLDNETLNRMTIVPKI